MVIVALNFFFGPNENLKNGLLDEQKWCIKTKRVSDKRVFLNSLGGDCVARTRCEEDDCVVSYSKGGKCSKDHLKHATTAQKIKPFETFEL